MVLVMTGVMVECTVDHTSICPIFFRSGDTSNSHPVLVMISSIVTSSPISNSVKPLSLSTLNTACEVQREIFVLINGSKKWRFNQTFSVIIMSTHPFPVNGRLHFDNILWDPSFALCSIVTMTFVPGAETKSMAPPIPLTNLPWKKIFGFGVGS